MNKVVSEVQFFIKIIYLAVSKFYKIEFKANNDLRQDLLVNMVTSLVMKDHTYSILMNTILQGY